MSENKQRKEKGTARSAWKKKPRKPKAERVSNAIFPIGIHEGETLKAVSNEYIQGYIEGSNYQECKKDLREFLIKCARYLDANQILPGSKKWLIDAQSVGMFHQHERSMQAKAAKEARTARLAEVWTGK